jgi:hypothetical protein
VFCGAYKFVFNSIQYFQNESRKYFSLFFLFHFFLSDGKMTKFICTFHRCISYQTFRINKLHSYPTFSSRVVNSTTWPKSGQPFDQFGQYLNKQKQDEMKTTNYHRNCRDSWMDLEVRKWFQIHSKALDQF